MEEILKMYAKGEVSAGRAAEMLVIPRAAFYDLLAERKVSLPEKLNQGILKKLKKLEFEKKERWQRRGKYSDTSLR